MTTNQKKQKKTSKLIKLDKITKRSDYLRASKSKYVRTNSFVIQFYNRNDSSDPRYGITATKKIGNAIKRNKAKKKNKKSSKRFTSKIRKKWLRLCLYRKRNSN